jgi:hypothetical protein
MSTHRVTLESTLPAELAAPVIAAWAVDEGYAPFLRKALDAAATPAGATPERWLRHLAHEVGESWLTRAAAIEGLLASFGMANNRSDHPYTNLPQLLTNPAVLIQALLGGVRLENRELPPINLTRTAQIAVIGGFQQWPDDLGMDVATRALPHLSPALGFVAEGTELRLATALRQAAEDRLRPVVGDLAQRLTAPYMTGTAPEGGEGLSTIAPAVRDALEGMRVDVERLCVSELRYGANSALIIGHEQLRAITQNCCRDCERLVGGGQVFSRDEILKNIRTTGGFNTGPRSRWLVLPLIHPHCRCRWVPA